MVVLSPRNLNHMAMKVRRSGIRGSLVSGGNLFLYKRNITNPPGLPLPQLEGNGLNLAGTNGGAIIPSASGLTLAGTGMGSRIFRNITPDKLKTLAMTHGPRLLRSVIPEINNFVKKNPALVKDAKELVKTISDNLINEGRMKMKDNGEGLYLHGTTGGQMMKSLANSQKKKSMMGSGASVEPIGATPRQIQALKDDGHILDGKRSVLDRHSLNILENIMAFKKFPKGEGVGKKGRGIMKM